MNKTILTSIFIIVAFIAGWAASFYLREPRTVTIKEYEIKYNTIAKNINDMSYQEVKDDLNCFYAGVPTLSIKHVENDMYELSASLCGRQWGKRADISMASKQYNNLIIGSLFLDSQLRTGANIQYYHFF